MNNSIFAKKENIKNNKKESIKENGKNNCKYSLSDNNTESDIDDTNIETQYMILSLDEILDTIPKNASNKFLPHLQSTHTEWRWRFFDIQGRKLIEISKQNPNKNRIYMDNMGKWVSDTLDNSWDQYVVDVKYCYVK
jgi:hypothetical protein